MKNLYFTAFIPLIFMIILSLDILSATPSVIIQTILLVGAAITMVLGYILEEIRK